MVGHNLRGVALLASAVGDAYVLAEPYTRASAYEADHKCAVVDFMYGLTDRYSRGSTSTHNAVKPARGPVEVTMSHLVRHGLLHPDVVHHAIGVGVDNGDTAHSNKKHRASIRLRAIRKRTP